MRRGPLWFHTHLVTQVEMHAVLRTSYMNLVMATAVKHMQQVTHAISHTCLPLNAACGAVAVAPLHADTVSGCNTVQQSTAAANVLIQSVSQGFYSHRAVADSLLCAVLYIL